MSGVTRCLRTRFFIHGLKKMINPQLTVTERTHTQRTYSSASDIAGVKERTLVAVKPDGVQRRLIGQIIKRFEQRGFRLVGLKMVKVSEELLAQHYESLHKKPFYPSLLRYMTSGPVVAMVWEGHNIVKSTRILVGDTNPAQAVPGTLRGDFSVHISRNIVHASDSAEVAQKEISLWFQRSELFDWEACDHSNIYHQ
ncbi:nucleoside diphosphate kinase, mitochondrial [Trichomycterus rosablanca]|uniref:nucleoside diphosphate kinase, mitochondrial n=1 Tax=Trichomycterus rosablanca TaxID=2290929 RepID=UPI002F34F491